MEDKTHSISIKTSTLFNILWIVVGILVLLQIKTLVLVVLTSVVIASFIGTSATSLKNRLGISRTLSVVVMYLVSAAGISVLFYFFLPVLIHELTNIIPLITSYFPNIISVGGFNFESLGNAGSIANGVTGGLPIADLTSSIKPLLNTVSSGLLSTLSIFFGGVANLVLVVIISFYLSISEDGIASFLRIIVPIRSEEYVVGLWGRAQRKIARWMSGQLLLGLIIGVLTFIGLTLLKTEYALLLAIVAGFFELIPFGIFLAAVPAVTLSFASGGISQSLMVVILYVVVQQIEAYLIAPLVVNKATGVSPLVVILSVLIGVKLAGFWGLILAVPVAVSLLEYIKDLQARRKAVLSVGKQNV